MSAVASASEALREAGQVLRSRDADGVFGALGDLLAAWRDPDGHWPKELAAALPACAGFSQRNVREGLQLALADWNEAALRELVAREIGDRPQSERIGFPLTSIVCGGAIPMPTLLQIVLSLVVRSPALVKPASRDPVTASLVAASLREVDSQLGACIEVVPLDTGNDASMAAFLSSECVVASGADATIETLRSRLAPDQRLVAYGHRFSIAAIGARALDRQTAEALALDVSLWDQLGCMSPVAIYAVGCDAPALVDFAEALAGELATRERTAPLGEIDAASGALVRHERDEARMRFAAYQGGRLYEGEDLRWTVVLETDAQPRRAPLHRFVRIHPVRDALELEQAVGPLAHQLSTAALAGAVETAMPALAGARVCEPGRMQCPPLGDSHDGQPLLLPLLR